MVATFMLNKVRGEVRTRQRVEVRIELPPGLLYLPERRVLCGFFEDERAQVRYQLRLMRFAWYQTSPSLPPLTMPMTQDVRAPLLDGRRGMCESRAVHHMYRLWVR